MKKFLSIFTILMLFAFSSSNVFAANNGNANGNNGGNNGNANGNNGNASGNCCLNGGGSSVPELSATSGPIAIALLSAIVGIGLERRRRLKAK